VNYFAKSIQRFFLFQTKLELLKGIGHEHVYSKEHHFCNSPDCSGNPFCIAKRNKKIGAESGTELSTKNYRSASKIF